MPMYEYVCTGKKCKTIFEELTTFDAIVNCPKCGKPGEKQIATTHHPVFVHRKGSFAQRRGKSKRRTRL